MTTSLETSLTLACKSIKIVWNKAWKEKEFEPKIEQQLKSPREGTPFRHTRLNAPRCKPLTTHWSFDYRRANIAADELRQANEVIIDANIAMIVMVGRDYPRNGSHWNNSNVVGLERPSEIFESS